MKHTRPCWLLLAAWCLLAGAGLAQEPSRPKIPPPPPLTSLSDEASDAYDQLVDEINVFRLWNGCAPIKLDVRLSGEAADIGLTEEHIQTLAESRLRVARLYDAAVLPFLYVRVSVLVSENRRGGTFSIDVTFNKYLRDGVSDRDGYAATWDTGGHGTHGGDADFILQGVSGYLDEFILEYLRVNETACR